MTPQTYKEQDFEKQISEKNYYHIYPIAIPFLWFMIYAWVEF